MFTFLMGYDARSAMASGYIMRPILNNGNNDGNDDGSSNNRKARAIDRGEFRARSPLSPG